MLPLESQIVTLMFTVFFEFDHIDSNIDTTNMETKLRTAANAFALRNRNLHSGPIPNHIDPCEALILQHRTKLANVRQPCTVPQLLWHSTD